MVLVVVMRLSFQALRNELMAFYITKSRIPEVQHSRRIYCDGFRAAPLVMLCQDCQDCQEPHRMRSQMGVAVGLGGRGNCPGRRQDPWKYIDAETPPIAKFNQVLRPESQG